MEIKDIKIKVNTEAESKKVQEKLFSLGAKWGGIANITASYLDAKGLYISSGLIISQTSNTGNYFTNHTNKEVTVSELLNVKVKQTTHLVVWTRGCGEGPHKEVFSEQEAKEEIVKLFNDREVVKTSVKVYKIAEKQIPVLKIGLNKA